MTHALFSSEASIERSAERSAREAALRSAAALQRELEGFLPSQKQDLARAILALKSEVPLWHVVDGIQRINSAEFTSRLMRLQESCAAAAQESHHYSTGQRVNQKGWAPIKQPTPGARSGTRAGTL